MTAYWTADQVKKEVEKSYIMLVKYVRLSTGEFRFVDGTNPYANHSDAVEQGKEKAVSAGAIKIKGDMFCFEGCGSTTLKLSPVDCRPDDDKRLEEVLGMKYVNSYDM